MRCSRVVALALLGIAAACHHPAATQVCHPVSSWMSPVVACAALDETDADEFDPEPSEEVEVVSEPEPPAAIETPGSSGEHPSAGITKGHSTPEQRVRSGIDPPPVEPGATRPVSDEPSPSTFKARVVGDVIEVSEAIEFEYRSHRLLARSKSVLDDVSWVLRRNPGILKVRIEGHTDSKASRRANRILSIKRAKAVRRYLIKTGVAARRLVAKGFGEASPIAANSTEEGRRQNRRVVFKILKQK